MINGRFVLPWIFTGLFELFDTEHAAAPGPKAELEIPCG